MNFRVFERTWWRINPEWPNGLEPHASVKSTVNICFTEAEAQACCRKYNSTNEPGRLSNKAEYEEVC